MTQANGTGTKARSGHLVASRVRPRITAADATRRVGRVAEEAQLRARVELARVLGETDEEAEATRALCTRLAAHDTEIDAAVDLALRLLANDDDVELRHALAGWFEGLGEPGLAAVELRRLVRPDAGGAPADRAKIAALLVRIGVLHARAGDAVGAEEAFEDAAGRDPGDALPLELLGAVAGWAPEDLPPRTAADAYVRAAKRRAVAGDKEAELEDLFRAFETDPTSPVAAAALAQAWTARGDRHAADEVLRSHATALSASGAGDEACDVHAQRRTAALDAHDLALALAAALDEGIDGALEGASADAMDDLLTRASAFEPLAVRLELRAEREQGRAAAVRWADLGRLLGGPLASPSLSVEAYGRAVAADVTHAEALHALRALVEKGSDEAWLREGLVRAALGAEAFGAGEDRSAQLVGARALAEYAESHRDEVLAAWAHGQLVRLEPSDERARAAQIRLGDALRRREEELARARAAAKTASPNEKAARLTALAVLLRALPDASKELSSVLAELVALRAATGLEDDASWTEAVRVAERVRDFGGIEVLCRDRLAGTPGQLRVQRERVAAWRRSGDLARAAREARALTDDAATRWTCTVAWIVAAAAGDAATRARALATVASTCAPSVAGAFATVAAEGLHSAGEPQRARRAAEQACRASVDDPRALVALAASTGDSERLVAVTALERAAVVAGARASLCATLAATYAALGETAKSVAWARRLVSLRPADPRASAELLDHACRLDDPEAIEEAILWVLPQPQPSKAAAERVVGTLRKLAERDLPRAAAVARRALDVLGPRHATLRDAIEAIAKEARDGVLGARLGERWLAAGAPPAERGPILLAIGEHYRVAGDVTRQLGAYARAARVGADLVAVEPIVSALATDLGGDAELLGLEVRAELEVDAGRTQNVGTAFRELGAAFWDMADDRPRAVQAWLRASQSDSRIGYALLRRDLTTFADAQYAIDCLAELAHREPDRLRSGMLATEAARSAVEIGAYPRALGLARTALERSPGYAEALEAAELACVEIGRVLEMSQIFDLVARRSLGRFGRRAAHHRAARFFEARKVPMLALKHAAQAFIAVPSEGTTLALLERTADRTQRRSVAARTVEHVAELSRGPIARAAWLLRAASLAATDLEGTRQRVDLLLKATVVHPAPPTLALLAAAAKGLLALAPEDREALAMRLERASDSLTKDVEGPDGARIALTFAQIGIQLFEDASWAWRAVERALGADGDVDEYAELVALAPDLARADDAPGALARVSAAAEKPYANVGHAVLRLIAAVALVMGDLPRRARALVFAAEKESDDDELVASAEEAFAASPEPALAEKLSRKVGAYRRAEALRAVARTARERGDHEAAARLLALALSIAPAEIKGDVTREHRQAVVAAGRGEDAVLAELGGAELAAGERAELWSELGGIRERSGDVAGACDAYLQAATEDGADAARWATLERVAEAAGREHVRVEALQHLVERAVGKERIEVQKRLARAEGARGSLAAAEAAWRDVLAAEPLDAEADVAIEALLVARTSFTELADHLGRRAARLDASDKDTLRAVRLRRAAILEQRLGRLEEATEELEKVLVDSPSHVSALRWLADLYERMGQPVRALAALEQLVVTSPDSAEYEAIATRRVRALLAAGDTERAREAARELCARVPSRPAFELRVEVARAHGDSGELGDALAELAKLASDDARARSEWLVEAAQAAARVGDTDKSLARARLAAKLAPDVPSTQLFARGLEYRLRGAGSRQDAEATVAALGPLTSIAGNLEPEDVALSAFLVAEAQDVLGDAVASEETLLRCHAEVGLEPLVALGLAERAAAAGRHKESVRFWQAAVSGNLLGLRRAGRVALAAADSSERAGVIAGAIALLHEAAKDSETRLHAVRALARLSVSGSEMAAARAALRSVAEGATGEDAAEALAELGRALFGSADGGDRVEADRAMRDAIDVAPEVLKERLSDELEHLRMQTPPASVRPIAREPGPAEASASVAPQRLGTEVLAPIPAPIVPPVQSLAVIGHVPPPPVELGHEEVVASVRMSPLVTPSAPPLPPVMTHANVDATKPGGAKVVEAQRALAGGARDTAERLLADALREGSLDAADMLDGLLANDTSRTAALVKVRRQAVELCPGEIPRLVALRDAARLDQNGNYVRALDHVIRAIDGAQGPLAPPPLSAQNAQPGLLVLLTRHSREAAGEAFGVVWEGAANVFSKPATAYGMTGLERVSPGPTSALSRVYEVALRLLDTPRFPLFHRRAAGPLSLGVALLASPSAILTGDAREDSRDLRWIVGHALSAVLAENALLLGSSRAEADELWSVLVGAFGPPGRTSVRRAHAMLAERLWQVLAPRAQRRLKELLAECAETEVELVLERARQSGRRVGMFLTGDFAHAARNVVIDYPGFDPDDIQRPGGLRRLCLELPSLADIFRLAVRPEYADARWHVATPSSSKFPFASGRMPPV